MRIAISSATRRSHLLLACCCGLVFALLLSTGCALEPAQEEAATGEVSIQIRFHGSLAQQQDILSASGQPLGFLPLLPIEYTDVSHILVDVTYADSGQPFALRFALTRKAPNAWEGSLPFLPRDQQLRFAAEAFDASDTIIFSGDTLATLSIDNQSVEIPLAPAQDQQTFEMPRMFRIAYPSEIVAGQEVQVIFTVEGNTGETIDYEIISDDGSPSFSPAAGSVTLTSTVADFVALYTAPEVTDAPQTFDYEVVITSAETLSTVSIATTFTTTVVSHIDGIDIVDTPDMSVLFNPVVSNLEANGTAVPDAVLLTATVSDDGAAGNLTYTWSYEPNSGTTDTTFLDTTSNPTILQGYTVDLQGTIHMAVTDENGGTTTLHYRLLPGQFADAIDHDAVQGLARIVAGNAHTCVRSGEGKVRCWGDAQFGQLGYGNTLDVGATLDRLPFTAGDVDLPELVRRIVTGNNHTCVLLDSGLVYCWGLNDHGQLGYGTTENLGDGEAVIDFGYVTLGGPVSTIAAGGDHTCALMQDSGALRCWGRNDFGQLGRGHVSDIGDDELVYDAGNVAVGTAVAAMTLGNDHTCVLLAGKNVRCWGRNDTGQLGYGHTQDMGDDEGLDALTDIDLGGLVRKLVAGGSHTCALLESGTMRCWGAGNAGQLGHGSAAHIGDDETPASAGDIDTGAPVTDIAAGEAHTCALLSNGKLTCWGEGANGRLGYGNSSDRDTPPAGGVDLQGTSAYRIAAGATHTCALRSNGTARCWGAGGSGRLGRGVVSDVYSPAAAGDIAIFEPTSPATYARSCHEHLIHNPGAGDGTYIIDPDGAGGAVPYEVYCDMTTYGGGWTLVLARSSGIPTAVKDVAAEGALTPTEHGLALATDKWTTLRDLSMEAMADVGQAILIASITVMQEANCVALVNDLTATPLAHNETHGCSQTGVDYSNWFGVSGQGEGRNTYFSNWSNISFYTGGSSSRYEPSNAWMYVR